jgi:hypothetical protein
MSERSKIKIIPKDEVEQKPENPLYNIFLSQMSAATELARKIEQDRSYPVPHSLRRFLDEFVRKTA